MAITLLDNGTVTINCRIIKKLATSVQAGLLFQILGSDVKLTQLDHKRIVGRKKWKEIRER